MATLSLTNPCLTRLEGVVYKGRFPAAERPREKRSESDPTAVRPFLLLMKGAGSVFCMLCVFFVVLSNIDEGRSC